MTTPATPRRQAKPFQVRNTHHELDGVKVPQGTPGAVRISVLTAKWYGYINGRPVPLRTDDYDLAVERLAVLRMEAGGSLVALLEFTRFGTIPRKIC